ncbi:MAG TPA: phosphate regulon sensor histidine kinase PhoR [Gammaproteobacteria bacterium]|nr:phosphate regulon sensor histidine kinase PhoR [Gammaproteobacteria bacterium]
MKLPRRWIRQFFILFAWLGLAAAFGLWIDAVAWSMVGGLLLYVGHMLFRLYQLDRAITEGVRVPGLITVGLWPELQAKVYNLRRKSRERKRRHLRLRREVRESTGAIADAGVILNAAHEIVWFNRAAIRLLGLTEAHDVGRRLENLLRNPEFVAYLPSPREEPLIIASPVERDRMLSIQVIPYGLEQSLVIARDVTGQVQLERTRRDFVANASHELRSPLTVIGGYLDALVFEEELSRSWQGPLHEMVRQVQRMTQILRDLIELTRLESAEEPASFDFVSVIDILGRIKSEYASRKPPPDLHFDIRSDSGLLGGETEIHSVFYNLISNAVRFTPPGGRIDVVWSSSTDGAAFSVRDTGIGIAAEQIPRLTERFYRVDPGRSRGTGGTGLGLAIVKHALQRHEAHLEIESVEGEGSTFRCVFPNDRVVRRKDAV